MKFQLSRQTFIFSFLILVLSILFGISAARIAMRLSSQSTQTQSSSQSKEEVKVVSEESVVIDVVKKASPSVVSIAIERKILELQPFSFNTPQASQTESGIGTGFVINGNGLILTNKHVVSEQGRYFAILKNGNEEKKYEVKQINKDPFNDLAILKIDASELKPLELGDSGKLQVGQKVIAIGNALGRLDNTVTTGIISGLGRGVSPVDPSTGIAEKLSDVIQTDAAINPGNSGGPLLNTAAQVIGVNVAVAGAENIGFALPINVAKSLISDFETTGKISRPFFGIRYTHINRDVALLNDVPEGELVREVVSGSSADKANVKVGDIVTEMDGQKLTEDKGLGEVIRTKKVGDPIKITVFRDGQTLQLSTTLGESPQE
jgi:S1-C subfamily serine protease